MGGERHYAEERGTEISDVLEETSVVVETRAVYDPERISNQILVGILYVHLLICCAIVLPTIRVSTVATSLNL